MPQRQPWPHRCPVLMEHKLDPDCQGQQTDKPRIFKRAPGVAAFRWRPNWTLALAMLPLNLQLVRTSASLQRRLRLVLYTCAHAKVNCEGLQSHGQVTADDQVARYPHRSPDPGIRRAARPLHRGLQKHVRPRLCLGGTIAITVPDLSSLR